MRTHGFALLLAAAFAPVSGQDSNLVQLACGSCGDCCPDGYVYQMSDAGEETCVMGLPAPASCQLCVASGGCPVERRVGSVAAKPKGAADSSSGTFEVSAGWLVDGAKAFHDVDKASASMSNVPAVMKYAFHSRYPWRMAEGFETRISCDLDFGYGGCDVYLMFYQGSGCDTGTPAKLTQKLLEAGYAPHECGPSLAVPPAEQEYNFLVFHKEIEGGAPEEVFEYPHEIEFLTTAFNFKTQLCRDIPLKSTCARWRGCQWNDDGSGCQPWWPCRCPKNGQGKLVFSA